MEIREQDFERDGRIWIRNALTEVDLTRFDDAALQSKAGQRINPNEHLSEALSTESSLSKAIGVLSASSKPVRVIAFNKSQGNNWSVPWHQDRVIAVAEKQDTEGFKNWTQKSGVWHCEPPQHILDRMLFVRVHLDDADRKNGAMQIAVGSHNRGSVPAIRAEEIAREYPIEFCGAKRGDVLILKMLTLHRSKSAETVSKRRVFRIDYASLDLPEPLNWN